MGMIIYSIFISVFMIFFCLTIFYKRGWLRKAEKSKAYLIKGIFWGMSAAIVDFIQKYIYQISYEKIVLKLNQLKPGNATKREGYVYLVSKISIALFVFFVLCVVGYGVCMKETFSDNKEITKIKRPKSGKGDELYSFTVKHQNQQKDLEVYVHQRDYTQEEAEKIFNKSEEVLQKYILGKNKSEYCITKNIVFPDSLDNGVTIDWEFDYQYFDLNGAIQWNHVTEKVETSVTAKMKLSGYEHTHTYCLILDPSKRNQTEIVSEEISKINENTSGEDSILLDDISKKYGVKFYKNQHSSYWIYFIFAIVTGVVTYFYMGTRLENVLEVRREELESDYASLVSKMMILQYSGMSLSGAWEKILSDFEKNHGMGKVLYGEMKYTRERMKNGYSEGQAYLEFGRRCGTNSYIKFSSLLEQNIKKGTKGLKNVLDDEIKEAFEIRKKTARKRGDKAGTKLLIPMIIMLVISMIIIMVPAILSFNL